MQQNLLEKILKSFDKKLKKNYPKYQNLNKIQWDKIDLIFTALPNGEAQKIAKKFQKK